MAPIRLGDGTGIDSVRLGDGTGIDEVRTGDGQTVFISFSPVIDTFDYLSSGENLDGNNGWTDTSGNMRGITSFSQTFTFNAVGRAVSSGDPNNFVGKGECFRTVPDQAYGRLKWRQSTDGGANGESLIGFRQNDNDIVKVEMSDTGGGPDGQMFVNDAFIADNNDGGFASDGCTVEFDLTLDYGSNTISGTAIQTNTNTTVSINEPFVNSASGLDEIYLWNTDDCAIIADEIEMLGS
jgi:hypothetical protein